MDQIAASASQGLLTSNKYTEHEDQANKMSAAASTASFSLFA